MEEEDAREVIEVEDTRRGGAEGDVENELGGKKRSTKGKRKRLKVSGGATLTRFLNAGSSGPSWDDVNLVCPICQRHCFSVAGLRAHVEQCLEGHGPGPQLGEDDFIGHRDRERDGAAATSNGIAACKADEKEPRTKVQLPPQVVREEKPTPSKQGKERHSPGRSDRSTCERTSPALEGGDEGNDEGRRGEVDSRRKTAGFHLNQGMGIPFHGVKASKRTQGIPNPTDNKPKGKRKDIALALPRKAGNTLSGGHANCKPVVGKLRRTRVEGTNSRETSERAISSERHSCNLSKQKRAVTVEGAPVKVAPDGDFRRKATLLTHLCYMLQGGERLLHETKLFPPVHSDIEVKGSQTHCGLCPYDPYVSGDLWQEFDGEACLGDKDCAGCGYAAKRVRLCYCKTQEAPIQKRFCDPCIWPMDWSTGSDTSDGFTSLQFFPSLFGDEQDGGARSKCQRTALLGGNVDQKIIPSIPASATDRFLRVFADLQPARHALNLIVDPEPGQTTGAMLDSRVDGDGKNRKETVHEPASKSLLVSASVKPERCRTEGRHKMDKKMGKEVEATGEKDEMRGNAARGVERQRKIVLAGVSKGVNVMAEQLQAGLGDLHGAQVQASPCSKPRTRSLLVEAIFSSPQGPTVPIAGVVKSMPVSNEDLCPSSFSLPGAVPTDSGSMSKQPIRPSMECVQANDRCSVQGGVHDDNVCRYQGKSDQVRGEGSLAEQSSSRKMCEAGDHVVSGIPDKVLSVRNSESTCSSREETSVEGKADDDNLNPSSLLYPNHISPCAVKRLSIAGQSSLGKKKEHQIAVARRASRPAPQGTDSIPDFPLSRQTRPVGPAGSTSAPHSGTLSCADLLSSQVVSGVSGDGIGHISAPCPADARHEQRLPVMCTGEGKIKYSTMSDREARIPLALSTKGEAIEVGAGDNEAMDLKGDGHGKGFIASDVVQQGVLTVMDYTRGATLRSSWSIDDSEEVGRLKKGDTLQYDAVWYVHAADEGCVDVLRYHVVPNVRLAPKGGWVSDRGRFKSDPYTIVKAVPMPTPRLFSHAGSLHVADAPDEQERLRATSSLHNEAGQESTVETSSSSMPTELRLPPQGKSKQSKVVGGMTTLVSKNCQPASTVRSGGQPPEHQNPTLNQQHRLEVEEENVSAAFRNNDDNQGVHKVCMSVQPQLQPKCQNQLQSLPPRVASQQTKSNPRTPVSSNVNQQHTTMAAFATPHYNPVEADSGDSCECPMCHQGMDHWGSAQRLQHVDRCLRQASSLSRKNSPALKPPTKQDLMGSADCSSAGSAFNSGKGIRCNFETRETSETTGYPPAGGGRSVRVSLQAAFS
ncbi:unnamed protein product, partial [Choristocarpus tenellus]